MDNDTVTCYVLVLDEERFQCALSASMPDLAQLLWLATMCRGRQPWYSLICHMSTLRGCSLHCSTISTITEYGALARRAELSGVRENLRVSKASRKGVAFMVLERCYRRAERVAIVGLIFKSARPCQLVASSRFAPHAVRSSSPLKLTSPA